VPIIVSFEEKQKTLSSIPTRVDITVNRKMSHFNVIIFFPKSLQNEKIDFSCLKFYFHTNETELLNLLASKKKKTAGATFFFFFLLLQQTMISGLRT
jgi:hypothetical protein